MKAGYKSFISQDAAVRHNIRGSTSLTPTNFKLGPIVITFYEFPPIRCYYTGRNTLYFALHESAQGHSSALPAAIWRVRPAPGCPGFMRGVAWRVRLLALKFLLRPRHHRQQIMGRCPGIWHGITGNVAARY